MIDRTGPDPKSENRHEFESERLLIALPRPPDAQLLFDLIGGEHRREICETLLWDGPDEVKEIEQWWIGAGRRRTATMGSTG